MERHEPHLTGGESAREANNEAVILSEGKTYFQGGCQPSTVSLE